MSGTENSSPDLKSATPDASTESRQDSVATFHQYRDLLFSIAYRMLGSAADAEDMLQETFIRWQQSAQADIESPRAFLVTILSRLCLQQLESARAKREHYIGQCLPEPIFTGEHSDPSESARMQESLSMAFLLLLEKLSPAERAAFLLHEVFDYEYFEIAEILDKSETNCRQLLRRARQHIIDNRPRFDPSPAHHKKLLEEFLAASASGQLADLVALLSDDVALYSDGGGRASASLNPIFGRDRVSRFLFGAIQKSVPPNVVTRLEEINGQPSIIYYPPSGRAGCVLNFNISDGVIQNIYIVTNPEKLGRLPRLATLV